MTAKSLHLSTVRLMPGILGVAILLFFGTLYPHHLHFQEQYQLFLYDTDYMNEVIAIPGGTADLAGRFFTQFFISSWAGATIVALLLSTIGYLVLRLSRGGWLQALCLLPTFVLWVFMCDENALLGSLFAILLALLADWGLSSISGKTAHGILLFVSAPLLYWIIGPIAILCYALCLIRAIAKPHSRERLSSGIALIIFCLMPIIAQYYVALPLERLYLSPHYYRNILLTPIVLWSAVLCIIVAALLPKMEKNVWAISLWMLVLTAGSTTVALSYDADKEETLAYDFMARFQMWNRLIDTADRKAPHNELSTTALNLALGMKGQLSEHMFEYPQTGINGLLPTFECDAVSPLTTSEVYYQLGMINTAQRYVFEAQEAIPDYQKSGRCYKRLAETALITGRYEVARKYLFALSKTWFYSDWAKEALALLGQEEKIQQHKEYGKLRMLMSGQDYIFNSKNTPKMLHALFVSTPNNALAYEYLQASLLLQKDVDSFVQCLEMGSSFYYRMPTMYQQALMVWWSRDHSGDEPVPDVISPTIKTRIQQFYAMFLQKPVNQEAIRTKYGNTYWYYYFQ